MKIRQSSDGLHLFDRRTGVNVLLDEVHVPPEEWSRAPRFVSFALTNLCDLQCPFCYAPKQPASLDFDRTVSWCREIDRNGGLGIGFGGGEPTYYPRFAELCRTVTSTTDLAVCFTTHAHRFSSHLRNELTGAVHFIRVSMDGVGETYEQIRNRPFSQLLQQLQIISDTCAFGINYVVNDATVGELDEAADIAFAIGASEMLLLPEYSDRELAKCTQESLEYWLAENSGRARLSVSETGITDGMPIADPFVNEKGTKAYMHVNASGRVSRTSYDQTGSVMIDSETGILAAFAQYGGKTK